jgi:hypothetical protein
MKCKLSNYLKISYCYLSEIHKLQSFKISKIQGVTVVEA